jgi:hypothetical protein
MTNYQNKEQEPLIRDYIEGSRRLSNIFWATAVSAGGLGFFLSGLSSFFKENLLFFSDSANIAFIPQGIVLIFYGTVGSILGMFLWLTIWWDVGFGYNEFSKENKKINIYRRGFPGKNRELYLDFKFTELKSIKMSIKDGLNPKRQLLLCLNDSREIPLTGTNYPIALNKIETDALKLAKYLNVYLETE